MINIRYSIASLFVGLVIVYVIFIIFYPLFPGFVSSPILLAQLIEQNGKIIKPEYNLTRGNWNYWFGHTEFIYHYPGTSLLITILSYITNLNICKITLNYPVFLFIYFIYSYLISITIIRKLREIDYIIITILALIISINLILYYGPHYTSIGFGIHLIIVYLLLNLTKNETYVRKLMKKYLFLFAAFFSLLFISYYTAFSLSITFYISFLILFIIFNRYLNIFNNVMINLRPLFIIGFIFLALFLSYSYASSYALQEANKLNKSELYRLLKDTILLYLTGKPPSTVLYKYGPLYKPNIYEIILYRITFPVYRYIFILLLLIIAIKLKNKKIKFLTYLVILTIFIVQLVDIAVYIVNAKGIPGLRYLSFFAPVLVFSMFIKILNEEKTKYTKLKVYLVIFLVLVLIATLHQEIYVSRMLGYSPASKEYSRLWEYRYITKFSNNFETISNYQLSMELRTQAVCSGKDKQIKTEPFHVKVYEFYDSIINKNMSKLKDLIDNKYLILSKSDLHLGIWGDAWGFTVPPIDDTGMNWIYSNSNKIFSSDKIFILNLNR